MKLRDRSFERFPMNAAPLEELLLSESDFGEEFRECELFATLDSVVFCMVVQSRVDHRLNAVNQQLGCKFVIKLQNSRTKLSLQTLGPNVSVQILLLLVYHFS